MLLMDKKKKRIRKIFLLSVSQRINIPEGLMSLNVVTSLLKRRKKQLPAKERRLSVTIFEGVEERRIRIIFLLSVFPEDQHSRDESDVPI